MGLLCSKREPEDEEGGIGKTTSRDSPTSDYIRQPPRKTSRHLRLFSFSSLSTRSNVVLGVVLPSATE